LFESCILGFGISFLFFIFYFGYLTGGGQLDIINLDNVALEIARRRLLEGLSYKELAHRYYTSPSTIHRRLNAWLRENRFELQDKLAAHQNASVTGQDDELAAALVRRCGLWRARVVRISGVEAAATESYLEDPLSEAARAALKAADDLHRCLGEAAAEILLNSLRKNMTIGISSGRGVGFSVEALAGNVRRMPAWVSGYAGIHLVSMCGGVHAGRWEASNPANRDFDADENVFALAAALGIPRANISYISGTLPTDSGEASDHDLNLNLDLAVIGLGQLNTRHHYFRDLIERRSNSPSGLINKNNEPHPNDPALYDNLAEIVMKLYPSGSRPLTPAFLQAIQVVNQTILSIAPVKIKNASELMLIAGGRQKVEALRGLLSGEYPEAPIDRRNLTLVTDTWTAETILRQNSGGKGGKGGL
jgi:DNA-binding transcriptional regulator LsrR (DeoR family)